MLYLLVVSLAWAFSFGLIKASFPGVSPLFISFARLFIALLVFLPFLRIKHLTRKAAWQLLLVGALQYGMMYITYNYAFQFLKAYEVALFTVFTPLYITLINDLMQRRIHRAFWLTALLAVAGTAIVEVNGMLEGRLVEGFLIVQASNLCFAFGQVFYREVMRSIPQARDSQVFAVPYLGAALIAL